MLAARIITAAVFGIAITAAILLAPPIVTAGVLGLLWLAGAWEWGAFARLDGLSRFIYTVAVVAAMLIAWRWLGPPGTLALLGVALVWWAAALVLVLKFPRTFGSGFVAVAGVLVLVPSWTLLVRLHGTGELGPWLAFLVLHELREQLLRLFAVTHGAARPYHAIEAASDQVLRARFGTTLPQNDLPSLQRAFLSLLDLLEHDLEALSAGQANLSEPQRSVLAQLRARQAALDLRTVP